MKEGCVTTLRVTPLEQLFKLMPKKTTAKKVSTKRKKSVGEKSAKRSSVVAPPLTTAKLPCKI